MSQPDGKGISRSVADARYGQPMVLSPIVALPFNHATGVNTDDAGNAVFKDLTWINIFKLTEATDHLVIGFDNFAISADELVDCGSRESLVHACRQSDR